MKKEIAKADFILVVLFAGIILSGTCFFGATVISSQISGESREAIKEEYDLGALNPFLDAVYGNTDVKNVIDNVSYRLFREIDDDNVIVGSNGFVFEIKYEGDGYGYLLDYMGETSFTDEELRTVSENIEKRRQAFEKAGKKYILAVIPNSVRVYSDCLPLHFGKPSKKSRLSQLSAAMVGNDSYIDLTDALTEARADGYVYNNTEDSVNAFGAYVIYRAVAERVNDGTVLYGRDELKFYTHLTSGRSVVRRAGVPEIVKNRTVSYTDDYKLTFSVGSSGSDSHVYTKAKYGYLRGVSGKSFIVAVDSDTVYQLMPFFSNTYRYVSYVTSVDGRLLEYSGDAVVEFVSERNLAGLLDMTDIESGNYGATGGYEEN